MNIDVMSASYIQAERILRVESPLGFDVLLPQQMTLNEKMSGLFELSLSVHSKRVDLKPEELVGKLADVSLETGSGARRTWNGLVTELIEGPSVTRAVRAYKLILRPQHWLLTQRSDCRIWLDRTSIEVAQILMGEHKLLSPVTKGIITPPKPQHYSVQFNETDLDYLTRRLEEDGIFFWFEHEGGAPGSVCATHTLHLASDISGYVRGPDTDVRFAMGSSDRNHVTKFEKTFRYLPGKRAGGDWNFLTPSLVPGGSTPSLVKLPKNDAYELYQYPSLAGYGANSASEGIDGDAVERQSKLRMMSSEADHERIEGASTVRTLSPGRRFKPYDVANPENVFKEHVIVEIIHTARDNSYETNDGGVEYENTFTAIPAKVPATPHRLTRRPKIEGTQVALVAGPEGEEIHPDQYGRIKLWFPWDRRAKKDGSDTCWVRVAQSWAGAGWGGQVIPRIGMEVMVTHLDGDPDRPLVTGVVPNSRQKVPYKLPENKTKSVFRSNTHKGKGFNEITFEDESGREELFLHAQKDQTIRVLNNRAKRIDLHQTESVGGNKNIDVGQSHQEKIGGNMHLAVGGVGGNLLEMLTKLVSASGAFMKKHDPKIGSEGVSEFAGAIEQVGVAKEAGALLANAIFAEAGGHRKTAGNEHTSKAAAIGGLLSKILPGSGTLNVIVEKFRSDTVGMARTEQIGLYKNTLVGHTQSISVGKTKRELIGEDFDFEAKKSIFSRTKKYTMLGKDKVVIGGPGGTIIIDETGVTIKARHIWFKSPQIDFENGSPDAVALSSDKPFAEDCSAKNRAKGKKGAAPAGGGKTPKRTGFASADAAAKAALKEANPKSISANREFGGNVFKDAKGQYGYSAPAKGSLAGFSPNPSNIPAGSTLVGDYHTHGNYSTAAGVATTKANDAFASDTFSPQDLSGITNDSAGTSEYKGYLGTPSGTFYKFDPLSGTPAAPAAPVVLK